MFDSVCNECLEFFSMLIYRVSEISIFLSSSWKIPLPSKKYTMAFFEDVCSVNSEPFDMQKSVVSCVSVL